mgnify:CR=1 FL=1
MILHPQEAEYIRTETRQQFRAQLTASGDELAAAVSERRAEGCGSPIGCPLHSFPNVPSAPPPPPVQLEEGERRLELGLHYGIAYPRLFHADQFEKVGGSTGRVLGRGGAVCSGTAVPAQRQRQHALNRGPSQLACTHVNPGAGALPAQVAAGGRCWGRHHPALLLPLRRRIPVPASLPPTAAGALLAEAAARGRRGGGGSGREGPRGGGAPRGRGGAAPAAAGGAAAAAARRGHWQRRTYRVRLKRQVAVCALSCAVQPVALAVGIDRVSCKQSACLVLRGLTCTFNNDPPARRYMQHIGHTRIRCYTAQLRRPHWPHP